MKPHVKNRKRAKHTRNVLSNCLILLFFIAVTTQTNVTEYNDSWKSFLTQIKPDQSEVSVDK